MTIQSYIGILNNDGSVDAIRYNWGGYPKYQGYILNQFYRSENKVRELISLGAIVRLGSRIAPNADEKHSFFNPIDDVTVAYHRDGGDDLKIEHYKDVYEFERSTRLNWAEYIYLFEDNSWTVTSFCTSAGTFKLF